MYRVSISKAVAVPWISCRGKVKKTEAASTTDYVADGSIKAFTWKIVASAWSCPTAETNPTRIMT